MASTIKVDELRGSTGSTVTIPTGQTLTMTDGLAHASLPTVQVAKGGTNLTSFTAGDVLYATGSTTLAKLPKGTAEQVLAMNAGATAPDWGSVDLTVLPTISVAKGGTNIASFTAGDILYATGSTTLAKLAKGTAAQQLAMNAGATAPEWITAAGGGILQMKNLFWSEHTNLAANSGVYSQIDTDYDLTITPTASNSSFLLQADIYAGHSNNDSVSVFNWWDSQVGTSNGDELFAESAVSDSRTPTFMTGKPSLAALGSVNNHWCWGTHLFNLYTPASNNGSARTFIPVSFTVAQTTWFNRATTDNANSPRMVSQMQVWEIANGVWT